jgi:integrase/recombinase XerD
MGASVVRRSLIPEFGDLAMHAITVDHVERYIAELRQRYSRTTTNRYYGTLRKLIRRAIRRGWYVGPNPLDRLEKVPTAGPGRDVTLTEEEAHRLLSELTGRLYFKCALALQTGLRWGEIHGLAWEDIVLDGEQPSLTVRRSYRGDPKNEASAATIPLSHDAVMLLRKWRAQLGPSIYVFPTPEGQIRAGRSAREDKRLHAATARAGIIKHVTPHVFRHTFGTWLYERTKDIKMVQRFMRHGSFKSSMAYVHDHRELTPVINTMPALFATDR